MFVFTEARLNKFRLYNLSSVGEERHWLQDILLSDSSDSSASGSDSDEVTEEDFQDMLKYHILRKKYQGRFYQKPEVKQLYSVVEDYYYYYIKWNIYENNIYIFLFLEHTVSVLQRWFVVKL